MNKKELQEIKKEIKWDNDRMYISKIGVAYGSVSSEEKKIHSYSIKDFSLFTEEEAALYLDILKKSLSGTLGKNLLEFHYEHQDNNPNPNQQMLYDLNHSRLENEEQFLNFVNFIFDNGHFKDNVFICIAHLEYHVPLKNTAGEMNIDQDENFQFLIGAVCPASLTDIGLFYNREHNDVERKINTEVSISTNPSDAFMYPIFSHRASDVNSVLYHAKTAKSCNLFFIEDILGCSMDLTAPEQTDIFCSMLSSMFENRLNIDTMKTIRSNINDALAENQEESDMLDYHKSDIKELLEESGADEKSMESFDAVYNLVVQNKPLAAVNMTESTKMVLKAPDVSISVKNEMEQNLKTKMIDGKRYILIQVDEGEVELNGVMVKI